MERGGPGAGREVEGGAISTGVGAFGPQIFANTVVTSYRSGSAKAFDLENGNEIWNIKFDSEILCSVGFLHNEKDHLIAGITLQGELVLKTQKNKTLWKTKLNGIVRVAPIVTESAVITLFADNRVIAFDINSGKRVWVINRRVPSLILHGQSDMSLFKNNRSEDDEFGPSLDEQLIVNMAGGRILSLDPLSGSVKWESRIVFPSGTNEVERIVDLIGKPFLDKEVCTSVYQNSIVCLSPLTGEVIWKRFFKPILPATFSSSVAIALDSESRITAFTRNDKRVPLWKNNDFFLRKLSSPAVWNSTVWFADHEGFIHGISVGKGKIISRTKIDSGPLSGAIKVVKNGLIIQTSSGQLIFLTAKTESER